LVLFRLSIWWLLVAAALVPTLVVAAVLVVTGQALLENRLVVAVAPNQN